MNRKLFLSALLFLCQPPQARAAETSLFFTPDEQTRIEAEIRSEAAQPARRSKHILELDSILYFGPQRWTIWLQGQRYTPESQSEALTILQVTAEAVTLRLRLAGGQEERTITLRAHQGVNILTGEIVEKSQL